MAGDSTRLVAAVSVGADLVSVDLGNLVEELSFHCMVVNLEITIMVVLAMTPHYHH
jgi:hypothetical protein